MNPRYAETLINLLMLLALFAGLTLWWFTKSGGYRGRIAERAREAATMQRAASIQTAEDEDTGNSRGRFLLKLAAIGDRLPLFDAKYRLKLTREMARGGYRDPRSVSILLAVKFVAGLCAAGFTVMSGTSIPMIGQYPAVRGAMMLLAFIVGMIVPEYLLSYRTARRRKRMAGCLPDALDLLVICTNAGNSLGVSIRRVADELKTICPPLSEELALTADELKLSGDSTRALLGLAERIDLPSMRALISTLVQSMRYGTPITQALRTLSRTERLAHIVSLEEKAAKLAPKMVVPMMLFILPAVVLIAAGPAVIQLMDLIAKQ